MKKFIKALEDGGVMERIISSGTMLEKWGGSISEEGLNEILESVMKSDENLEDIFLQEAHAIAVKSVFKCVQKKILERQKIEALNHVNVDALFAKATGKKPVKEEPKIDYITTTRALSALFDEMFVDILRNRFDDGK
jgi:hypothetical protein